MKKTFGAYSLIWLIVLGLFNLITFITPHKVAGVSKFTGTFWAAFISITVMFVLQLVATFLALRAKDLKAMFYRLPLISVSYTGLVAMLIVGSVFMALPILPFWLGIILCAVVFALNLIALIKATVAAVLVEGTDTKVRVQTVFIRELTLDAQELAALCPEALRDDVKTVYEAIRYSDPMSADALIGIEAQIRTQFRAFANAVTAEDAELAKESAETLLALLTNRAQRCKAMK